MLGLGCNRKPASCYLFFILHPLFPMLYLQYLQILQYLQFLYLNLSILPSKIGDLCLNGFAVLRLNLSIFKKKHKNQALQNRKVISTSFRDLSIFSPRLKSKGFNTIYPIYIALWLKKR